MTPLFRPEPAVLAPLLLALWGAGGLATAQPADAAPGGARTILVGPQAPTAPTVQQTERLQRQAAPRARFLGEAAPGYAVNTHDREAVRLFYATVFASSQGVSSGWTGSVTRCDPGSTSAAYQQATQRRINWFRAMAGVPAAVVLDEGFSRKAQQTALMMSAQRQLSHFPDASWACYSPEGAEGAANSNLGLGSAGAQAVAAGYMQDFGDSNAPLGHRRWVLYPQTRVMGVGDAAPEGQEGATPANALWVFDAHLRDPRPAVRDDFVAWPPPGYAPWTQVYPRWSLSYPNADFSRATVRMTENGQQIATRLEPVSNGFGENTLAWLPGSYRDGMSWARPAQDTVYAVQVDNVLVGGQPRSFSYQVTVFDPAVGVPLAAPQGPAALAAGQAAEYALAPTVAGADLQWRAVSLADPAILREDVEADSAAWLADTSPGYAVVTGDDKASGARSFHLAHPAWRDQVLQWRELLVPDSSAQLSFSSRLGLATTSQLALVEVSQDEGLTWQQIYRQAGQGPNQWERGFSRRTIPLAAYADRTIQVRWRYAVEGSAGFYPQTEAGIGWYIDDIELTGTRQVLGATPPAPAPAGRFQFGADVGDSVLLQGRQGLYGHYAEWSQALRVQVSGSALSPQDAQAECVMNWAERTVPELLAPPTFTRTDVPGQRYRLYASGGGSTLSFSQADAQLRFQGAPGAAWGDLGPLADWTQLAGCR